MSATENTNTDEVEQIIREQYGTLITRGWGSKSCVHAPGEDGGSLCGRLDTEEASEKEPDTIPPGYLDVCKYCNDIIKSGSIEDRSSQPHKCTQEACIKSLKSVADDLGHSPSIREFEEAHTILSYATVIRLFGTWNDAKEAAGLDTVDPTRQDQR